MKISTLRTLLSSLVVVVCAGWATQAQEYCGGTEGLLCDNGQFCLFEDRACRWHWRYGVCTDVPPECPELCDPVCGCDGVTYVNRCEAALAGASVDRTGSCDPGSATVALRGFFHEQFGWYPLWLEEAWVYNVYINDLDDIALAPESGGRCLYHTVPFDEGYIHGKPEPHQLWTIQVTPLFAEEGEGSMGLTGDCKPRKPIAPCTCTLLPDAGPCTLAIPRWYHDFNTRQCEEFSWGGCGGNANNFATRADCEAECMDLCSLPPIRGFCEAYDPSWYYSPLSGHCERFVFGGCDGNDNRFSTQDACQAACGDTCLLPADTGDCEGICPRWHFDPRSGRCEKFIWGCCGGNRNNFATQEECEAECAMGVE